MEFGAEEREGEDDAERGQDGAGVGIQHGHPLHHLLNGHLVGVGREKGGGEGGRQGEQGKEQWRWSHKSQANSCMAHARVHYSATD